MSTFLPKLRCGESVRVWRSCVCCTACSIVFCWVNMIGIWCITICQQFLIL